MQTKDHLLLARYIIKNQENTILINHSPDADIIKRSYQNAFIFGCIEPDINVFSYLRGLTSRKRISGHNYKNVVKYLDETSEILNSKDIWSMSDYFEFGVYIHYLTDAFTYPHNDTFTGTLKEHCEYEEQLHEEFCNYLNSHQKRTHKRKHIIKKSIKKLHSEYLKKCGNPVTDCKYILKMVSLQF